MKDITLSTGFTIQNDTAQLAKITFLLLAPYTWPLNISQSMFQNFFIWFIESKRLKVAFHKTLLKI